MIRVFIVDDSPFLRRVLKGMLVDDEEIVIIGEAQNGKEALEKIPLLKPDMIILDIEMPVKDGISTLKNIVKTYDIPVIMMSNFTTEGTTLTLKALEEGAIDFIPKPKNILNLKENKTKQNIIQKIKVASKSKAYEKYTKIDRKGRLIEESNLNHTNNKNFEYIVAIGTSTGGPRALQEVLPLFPENINSAIVVVQHMPSKFTKSLADRLNTLSNINVKEGEHGIKIEKGTCYIAPGDFHMKIVKKDKDYLIELSKSPIVKGLRPSVDVLMKSVAKIDGIKKIGVIMTGMGTDGSDGILDIKKTNGYTIAQDEKSSVIFGMPKAAIGTGCIDKVVSLNKIATEIIRIVGVY
ncbi:chemotaxis response regulator protein-glutamate methylesterase [Schnuerera sp. xch1]|uniref:protein-glutamate methylesterase/protein-glutamine glutaminase n=1 Tax=Schnuerera sp. xch1 TaxID=2874283 RepID=UPI001CBBD350|nr:chemotaxis response regulator protein-glutamate methylesterase [Schnuerera sp. xch1]MBZ2173854.1 chemotaxis response regulator protein-glutamate methylesterase [Schnuerera sp. xch1]